MSEDTKQQSTIELNYKGIVDTDSDKTWEDMDRLVRRLGKIGITISFTLNVPWIYIRMINGKVVKEKRSCEHGFTIGFFPIRLDDYKIKFLPLRETFKLIRKYAS